MPGSIGIASWIISRPSTSRVPETTPLTTLKVRPSGFPTVTIGNPSGRSAELPRASGTRGRAGGSIRRIARSSVRSEAVTSTTR